QALVGSGIDSFDVRVRLATIAGSEGADAEVEQQLCAAKKLDPERSYPYGELAELYGQAELCVFPSTCENAGSFALFDGFHAGVPTICSDRSSMPEMARGAAILVNPHDERALGEAILDVLGSPTEQERLAAAAREWSRTAPTWATRAAALVHFVDGLSR
ncbi:MAG TPA: glycosyltransferase, partial [Dermatophilaceae bacterium]|nr:glycosyltransferase [Dermatophilaceae bacterium]